MDESKNANSLESKNYGQENNEISNDHEKIEELKKLYIPLVCALTHNMEVCESCRKCFTTENDFAEFRVNLIKKLEELLNS